MGRLSGFNYREIVKKLEVAGFEFFREAKGSHEIWFSVNKNRYTTIPRHRGDMPEGTLRNVIKQADIEVGEFLKL